MTEPIRYGQVVNFKPRKKLPVTYVECIVLGCPKTDLDRTLLYFHFIHEEEKKKLSKFYDAKTADEMATYLISEAFHQWQMQREEVAH